MSINTVRSATLVALAGVTSICCNADVNSGRQDFLKQFVAAAIERTHHTVRYLADYVKIPYPGGDVPAGTGVCSDEVIRAYRTLGVDLQKEVHEDMEQSFSSYPHPIKWLAIRPDANRPPSSAEPDGIFLAKRREFAAHPSGGGLCSWRISHLGPRGKRASYRDRGGSEITLKRTLHDCPQRRAGATNGRRFVCLENHGALPVLRTEVRKSLTRHGHERYGAVLCSRRRFRLPDSEHDESALTVSHSVRLY